MFACLMIRHFEEVAGFLCPEEVIFHSQDGKAKGSIRLTATNKQALLVMHIECNVRLPDHNFLIAKQQKLVALVIVDIEKVKVKTFSSDAVTYSGPTYIGIQSAKHLGSGTYNHLVGMKQIQELSEFERNFKDSKNEEKLVMIVIVDGGPDEKPRYEKAITCVVDYFNTFDLDVFLLVTNAPGRREFNRVDRRMARLSKESGGVLPEHILEGILMTEEAQLILN